MKRDDGNILGGIFWLLAGITAQIVVWGFIVLDKLDEVAEALRSLAP